MDMELIKQIFDIIGVLFIIYLIGYSTFLFLSTALSAAPPRTISADLHTVHNIDTVQPYVFLDIEIANILHAAEAGKKMP